MPTAKGATAPPVAVTILPIWLYQRVRRPFQRAPPPPTPPIVFDATADPQPVGYIFTEASYSHDDQNVFIWSGDAPIAGFETSLTKTFNFYINIYGSNFVDGDNAFLKLQTCNQLTTGVSCSYSGDFTKNSIDSDAGGTWGNWETKWSVMKTCPSASLATFACIVSGDIQSSGGENWEAVSVAFADVFTHFRFYGHTGLSYKSDAAITSLKVSTS